MRQDFGCLRQAPCRKQPRSPYGRRVEDNTDPCLSYKLYSIPFMTLHILLSLSVSLSLSVYVYISKIFPNISFFPASACRISGNIRISDFFFKDNQLDIQKSRISSLDILSLSPSLYMCIYLKYFQIFPSFRPQLAGYLAISGYRIFFCKNFKKSSSSRSGKSVV